MATDQKETKIMAESGNQQLSQSGVTVIVQKETSKSNGIGTAGFIMSLLSLLLCWVPAVDVILWFLGALFSFIGLFKKPRGLAIAGFIISFIGIIIIIAFFGAAILALANLDK